MSISWASLRPLRGSQPCAFEELCCQLAALEHEPAGAQFVRVGAPDAGVEAYWVNSDGREKGWQAKFFLFSPDTGQWGQIDKSVRTALDKHPRLVEYTVCLPINRSDAREGRKKSFMEKWNDRVKKWTDWATKKGMQVHFVYWGNHEILERLSRPANAGRVRFWFSTDLLSPEWFVKHVAEAEANAGPRYTPEVNVEVPVATIFDALGRMPEYFAGLRKICRRVRYACLDIMKAYSNNPVKTTNDYHSLKEACGQLIPILDVICDPDKLIAPWDVVRTICQTVGSAASSSMRELLDKEAAAKGASNPTPANNLPNNSLDKPDYGYARHLLSEVSQATLELERIAESINSRASNERQLCVIGEAGKGKTHLMCDVAHRRVNLGYPTLILLGEHFAIPGDPWDQITRRIGFSGNAEELLGALESASIATDSRGLILIDALNEGAGKDIWPHHLAGFLTKVRQYEHIGIAVSIRTSYVPVILPEHLDESQLVRITHEGFSGVEFEATDAYFQYYHIAPPSVPLLVPEFSTPLFLKLICKGLHNAGMKVIPPGFHGVTRIFGFFVDSVNDQLSRKLDIDPKERVVPRAVDDLAKALLDEPRPWLPRAAAKRILESIRASKEDSKSLLYNLLSEGLLTEDRFWNGKETVDGVRFAYERLSDHLVVKHLLDLHLPTGDAATLFRPEGMIGQFLKDEWACYRNKGLVEALSIQVPERVRLELGHVAPRCASFQAVVEAFLQSLPWRDVNAVNEHTRAYINKYVVRDYLPRLYDTLLTVATNPDHPYNARMLHGNLLKDSLPERDYFWTLAIQSLYGEQSAVDRLIKWAWSNRTHSALSDESVRLGATALAWFLTAAHRFLRDRATKALVNLLTPRIHLLKELLRDFESVNDPYVTERLLAAAYGCAMRSKDYEGVESLALYIYNRVFDQGTPPAHLQARDYERGIVEIAYLRNPELDICPLLIFPPYGSVWPRIPTPTAIERLKKKYEKDGKRVEGFGDLYFSIMDDDFARYVIGTNTGHCDWSPTPLGMPLRYKTVKHKPDPKMDEYYRSMGLPFKSGGTTKEFERFDLSQIQRYVLWRVMDLGWSPERFGEADHWLKRLNWNREANKVERIGKKYQWIAYQETLAFMADNFEFAGDHVTGDTDIYEGPWQLTFGRDIDPSHTLNVPRSDEELVGNTVWWSPLAYDEWDNASSDVQWIERTNDLPDEQHMIEVANAGDTSEWFSLRSVQHWKTGDTRELRYSANGIRELWYEISSFIIRAEDTERVLQWAKGRSFGSLDVRRPGQYHGVYLGEHYWAEAAHDYIVRYDQNDGWEELPDLQPPITVLQTAQDYQHESSGYDCSCDTGFSFYIPRHWLVEKMRLEWNRKDATYLDAQGNVVIFDPTVFESRSSCLLARKETLREFLEQSGYNLLWILRGEKRVLSDPSRWEEHLEISGAFTLESGKLIGRKWFHLRRRDGLHRMAEGGKIGPVMGARERRRIASPPVTAPAIQLRKRDRRS